jgi:putative ABC transport system permease protein
MVFLLSGSESVFQSLLGGLTRAGARTLYVVPGTQTILTGLPRRPFTQREADALERRIPDVEIAAPLITLSSVAQLCGATRIVRLIGVLPLNEYVDSLQVANGRFVTDMDQAMGNRVAVVGSRLAEDFPCVRSGASIVVGTRTLRVVGALKPKGQMMLGDFDIAVLVPLRTAEIFHLDASSAHRVILILLEPGAKATDIQLRASSILREMRDLSPGATADFEVVGHTEIMRHVNSIRLIGAAVSFTLTGIGLVIALIGLANSVFAGVVQRTNEIGLLRCVGATRADIRRMFLLETCIIVSFGVAAGTSVGVGALLMCLRLMDMDAIIRPLNLLVPAGLTLLFGVLAAIGPAEYAARLSPLVAVGHE